MPDMELWRIIYQYIDGQWYQMVETDGSFWSTICDNFWYWRR